MTYAIVWRYRVPAPSMDAFERAYGPDGAWVELFRRFPAFLGTALVRADEPGVYLTIDRWASAAAYEAFLRAAGAEYERLDGELASLTEAEELVARGAQVEGAPAG
jgi:heme-degrading monooxygenase HmoA